MLRISRIASSILLLLASVSLSPVRAADKVREAVERANQSFAAAYAAHDSAKLAAFYAPDGAVFPPGGPRANGREAIGKFWQGAMDAGFTNLGVRTIDVTSSGALASETGEFAVDLPDKDGKLVHMAGKYVVVWKRARNGAWQIYRDIWNEAPPR